MTKKITRIIHWGYINGQQRLFFYKPSSETLVSSNAQSKNLIGYRYDTVTSVELFVAIELIKNHSDTHVNQLFIVCIALVNGDIRATLLNTRSVNVLNSRMCDVLYCATNSSSILLFDSPDERERIVRKALSV